MKQSSEFGKGLTYCLGLFLAHAERQHQLPKEYIEKNQKMYEGLWLYAASDHLYELEIPKNFPKKIKDKIKALKDYAFTYRLTDPPIGTKEKLIQEAKDLLLMIDKHIGIKAVKGDFE